MDTEENSSLMDNDNDNNNDNTINVNSIPDPTNMKLVKEEHNKLQQAIQDLSHNISIVLSQQETNFLTYYQKHIKQIQGEFQILQTDIQEKEFDIKNNTYVKELEKERDWYKIEAIHLDKLVTKLKEDNRYLTQKLTELNDDSLSTKNHLKSVLKDKDALENLLVKYGIEPNCNLEDILLSSNNISEQED